MIPPAPASIHRGPPAVLPTGASTGECVSSIGDYHCERGDYYRERFEDGPLPRIVVSTDGPYALIGWQSGGSDRKTARRLFGRLRAARVADVR